MAKTKSHTTPNGIRAWERACSFTSHREAALALSVPLRTYARWLSTGIPDTRPASVTYREFIVDRMNEILRDHKKAKAKA